MLLWRRGSSVLTADKIMVVRDARFELVDGFNLQLTNVMPQDAGDYVCQIGDGDYGEQIHTVEILGKCSCVSFAAPCVRLGTETTESKYTPWRFRVSVILCLFC